MRALRPADPARLEWLRPEGVPEDAFRTARERLAPRLAQAGARAVYEARRRAIYRVADPALGPVAVKEVRSGDNLLVTGSRDRTEVRVIDFAHAALRPGFDPEGFARDAGRIAAGLVLL